ncbi:hypothetical protein K457DRAFT_27909 [Linnemannia elongata AG-77]|uniref:Uncharacterized protein n=1 Tax=Linnemannia elongata AG-77 TaxID=1314771 RepID=A0A197KEK9_9FUNG|nr:hypothetical protein K457DRAFT_27909 [Linnemannia elongata AG-77]
MNNNRIEILSLRATCQDTASWLSDPSLPWLDSSSLLSQQPQQQQQQQQQPNPSHEPSSPRPDHNHPVSLTGQLPSPALTTATTTVIINNNNTNNNITHATTIANNNPLHGSASPITRLPVDILLYIASLRFLTLNDIVQWRATASVFYHSIPLPNAAMILQAAHLFQVRPRRGHRETTPSQQPPPPNQTAATKAAVHLPFTQPHSLPPTASASSSTTSPLIHPSSHPSLLSRVTDVHTLYRDRQLLDIIERLTRLLLHPDFQPRLMRSAYSFRNHDQLFLPSPLHSYYDDNDHQRRSSLASSHHDQPTSTNAPMPTVNMRRKRRTPRDMQDYPIFLTGNPPDLVRLAIEFGHVPFVDHLLYRGFRPRDLPEYFSLIPFLTPPASEDSLSATLSATDMDNPSTARRRRNTDASMSGGDQATSTAFAATTDRHGTSSSRRESKDQNEQRNRDTALLKRSLELNQIWECMRLASQELMDACSRADFDAVLKVLDSILVKPRLSLEESAAQDAAPAPARDADDDEVEYLTGSTGHGVDRYGKRRQSSLDPIQSRHDSIGTGSEARFLDDDPAMTATMQEMSGAGVGTSSSHRASAVSVPSRDRTLESSDGVPSVIHRSSLFRPRSRVSSDGGCTTSDSNDDNQSQCQYQFQQHPTSDTFSGSDNTTNKDDDMDPPPHMPWIDGRALTSALLAVCFRRDGYESPEAELDEELRAVPIVKEILKYDCMLTAQSLGQAVLGVAYSRSTGSLKRAREQRLLWRKQRLYPHRRQDQSVSGSSSHSRRGSIAQGVAGSDTSAAGAGDMGVQGVGLTESVMDLLLERIGPREWLKLIKCYLQRQEFEDLAIVLERCPFKGPQLETRNKDQQQDKKQQQRPYSGPGGISFGRAGAGGGYNNNTTGTAGGSLLSPHQGEYDRQRAREMICRETGICGVGTRIGLFNGRGSGQASFNVSSTLYEASRVLFTGSGTRFSHSYMLPRGGFRGIGGNSSGHTGSPNNSTASQVAGAAESLHAVDDQEMPVPHMAATGVSESNQTPPSSSHQQQRQQQIPLQTNSQDQDNQPPQFQTMHYEVNDNHDSDESSIDSDDDLYGDEEDDPESNIEQFESHDSNFAFGGVGSSTTSSSRPGPGIVGIAIQVRAPENILNALLKMGFRFFSICDLSISDSRHPLALQFRQQEKMNRQLIEFCMVPNLERLNDVGVGAEESGGGKGEKKGKGGRKGRKFDRRDESRYDEADREAHALVVQAFLYPAANNPTRGWSSIPALPTMMSSISQRIRTVSGGYLASPSPSSPTPAAVAVLPVSAPPSPSAATTSSSAPAPASTTSNTGPSNAGPSMLTPSNRLQFVLPPMQLGDSFESISTIVKFADQQNPDLEVPSSNPTAPTTPINTTAVINDFNDGSPSQSTLTQGRYRQSGFATSTPLPIRTSMVEKRLSAGSTFFAIHNNNNNSNSSNSAGYHIPHSPNSSTSLASAAIHFANQQRMLLEATRRRVRETLRSDYMDLMTVGICLYQACYHEKETLLTVLLEHRLLIAQDALTGAVQVAASVGWKRGLELLLVQCGDMEAEIEPVVTTTSEYVHLGSSMKWDHATAVQVFPNGRREPGSAGSGGRSNIPGSLGARRGARVAAAGGLEGLVTRGLRRHRSDGSRLNRFGDGLFGSSAGGPSYTTGDVAERPAALNRRASFELSRLPIFQSGVFSTSPTSESPTAPVQSPLMEPVIPSARSSSLRSKLSSLIPNLAIASGSTTDLSQKPTTKNKQQPPTQQPPNAISALFTKTAHRPDQPPAILMLSTSGLWSLPTVMMQRKSRNAVVALMAACTRNDPALVTWLIETFADIKVVHIMQALMIACDRGLLRVVKALLGGPLDAVSDGHEGGSGKKKATLGKRKKDATAAAGSSRSLFRRWLAFQYQQILDMTQQSVPTSSSSMTIPPAGSGVAEQNNEKHDETTASTVNRTDPEGDSTDLPRFDSFPFVFLMESSPLFRHYYQTLNTLSSCQFMMKRSGVHPVNGARTTATASAGSPLSSSGAQQQQQQSSAPEHDGENNNPPRSSSSAPTAAEAGTTATTFPPMTPLQRRASASASTSYHPSSSPQPPKQTPASQLRQTQVSPQDIKREIIRLMLAPILETLGPISVRKALDRLPKDSWWPLDHDVRTMVDQEARKDMVAVVMAMKRRQKQKQERELRVSKAMRQRAGTMDADADAEEMSSGGEGVGGVVEAARRRRARQESSRAAPAADLQQLSEQKKGEQRWKGKARLDVAHQGEEEEEGKKLLESDRWHKASGPFRRVRKWVVERKKKTVTKDHLAVTPQRGSDKSEEEGMGCDSSGQGTEKTRPFDLTSTRQGLTVVST